MIILGSKRFLFILLGILEGDEDRWQDGDETIVFVYLGGENEDFQGEGNSNASLIRMLPLFVMHICTRCCNNLSIVIMLY